jgi:microcystin-dependent protein
MTKKSLRSVASIAALGAALGGGLWSPAAKACSSEAYIGSICIFAGNFDIRNNALAQGQLLSIAQNTALFSILGTTYGGNGQTTFALPDTRGRVVIGQGQGPGTSSYQLGQVGGTESVTLTQAQMPLHTHAASTTLTLGAKARGNSATGNADGPGGNTWAARPRGGQYSTAAPDVDMKADTLQLTGSAATTVGAAGGSQPFAIVQPYVTLNYQIVLFGIFPSRN